MNSQEVLNKVMSEKSKILMSRALIMFNDKQFDLVLELTKSMIDDSLNEVQKIMRLSKLDKTKKA